MCGNNRLVGVSEVIAADKRCKINAAVVSASIPLVIGQLLRRRYFADDVSWIFARQVSTGQPAFCELYGVEEVIEQVVSCIT